MNHPERVEDFLEHIVQAIERATEYIQHLDGLSAFQQNQRPRWNAGCLTVVHQDFLL